MQQKTPANSTTYRGFITLQTVGDYEISRFECYESVDRLATSPSVVEEAVQSVSPSLVRTLEQASVVEPQVQGLEQD